MKSCPTLLAVLFLALTAFPVMAAPPSTLTLNDLRNSPERWPAEITVPKDLRFQGGRSVKQGQRVRVIELSGTEVVVNDGKGLVFGLPIAETDLLARANEAWAALTPAQREITAVTLMQDRDLWPLRVRSVDEYELNNGTLLKAGSEYELLSVGRNEVQLFSREHRVSLKASLPATDLIARARALALVPAEQRPSRIAAALRGTLVDAAGQPADPAGLEATQVFALYYGASWCGPCRKFSPDLVKFVNRVGPANPRLTVVLMSNDKSDAAMYGYMREEKMPWVAMPLDKVNAQPALTGYVKGGIPHLVVVDRQGKILADSYRGTTYIGPMAAMQQLEQILATGVAK
jgi:nucleoredoxin